MWTKYTFTCDPDECDALLEFTSRDGFGFPLGELKMSCACGRMMNYISYEDATCPDEPVTHITYTEVVKINTNPYTL